MPDSLDSQVRHLSRDVADARARLEAGLRYGETERERLAGEVVAAERRLAERLREIRESIVAVDAECAAGRELTTRELGVIRNELTTVRALVTADDKREQRKASTTVAWVGGAFVVLGSLVQTIGQIVG